MRPVTEVGTDSRFCSCASPVCVQDQFGTYTIDAGGRLTFDTVFLAGAGYWVLLDRHNPAAAGLLAAVRCVACWAEAGGHLLLVCFSAPLGHHMPTLYLAFPSYKACTELATKADGSCS